MPAVGCASRRAAPAHPADDRRPSHRRRHLFSDQWRSASPHRALRPRDRRLPQRAAVESRVANADRRRSRALGRSRRAHRQGLELHGAALRRDAAQSADAQQPALPPAAGAGSGLLGRERPDRTRRRRPATGRRAGEGDGIQRCPEAPEAGGSALPVLGGCARPARMGRDAERISLHHRISPPRDPRVDRGHRPRRQPSLRRRLGSHQRILGRAQPA